VKTHIKKGDMVVVRSGRDKGAQGRVLAVIPDAGRAVVEHVNVARKHRRQRSARDTGGITSVEMPIALSKLMLLSDNKPTRVRIQVGEGGVRQRISVKTGKTI
jgi:large subunit ribosomal protein L24